MPEPVRPRPAPSLTECTFYHSFDFPDGETVHGWWDIRGRFEQYIGNYPLAGKTVLDIGTASGFLAFCAEQRGARVTAFDVDRAINTEQVPHRDTLYLRDRAAWARERDDNLHNPMKASYWYAWHKYKSGVETVYGSLREFPYWNRTFDVVIAGALLEHLADPVSAIGAMARLANDAVIIAFTPVLDREDLFMYAPGWTNPKDAYSWWALTSGLYRRIFENLGFEIEIVQATAIANPNYHHDASTSAEHVRQTVIARRIR